MTRGELLQVCFSVPVVAPDESIELVVAGDVIGHVGLYWRTLTLRHGGEELPVGGVGAVCVHPDWRLRGIATDLLDRADEFFLSRGLDYAALFCGEREYRTLYEEQGYVLYEQTGWPANLAISPLRGTANGATPLMGRGIEEPPERW